MPKLMVITNDVKVMMDNEGLPLHKLDDINYMAKYLSVTDLADIHTSLEDFPFKFDADLGIELADSPLAGLAADTSHEDLYNRVKGRVETNSLRDSSGVNDSTVSFTLHPTGENLWVAVQQRLHTEPGDPNRLLLKANTEFFDSLIGQVLHTQSFESVCSTNLFTNYLGSL